ncbi:hypothetical protein Mgra_00008736 [Meloidogyne graminicola]|uniref:Iron-binding zinc finger CDGSH type domain-containing protein n=1 Tax=Meloidogyne graminicola TaxID=189291 RepID=A0A8S9ZEZ4_9BILA|nr:hypothetical protein Mgra_00008736 [Meloidogyne graminicola]
MRLSHILCLSLSSLEFSAKTGWGPYRLHRVGVHFVGTEPSVLKYHHIPDKKLEQPYGLQGTNHLLPGFGKVYSKLPTKAILKKDKVYTWCSCGYSGSQPLCDGTHLTTYLPDWAVKLKPVRFIPDRDMEVWFCNCKQTKNRPFCDGSHKILLKEEKRTANKNILVPATMEQKVKQMSDEKLTIEDTDVSDLFKEVFQIEPCNSQRLLNLYLETEKDVKGTVQLMCSNAISDYFFVDVLIAQFSNRTNSEFVSFVTKNVNKPSMRAICQRLSLIMEKCRKDDDRKLESNVVLLVSLLASCSSLRISNDESRQWVSFLANETNTDDVSLKIALATILASPNLMLDQTSFRDEQIGKRFKCIFSYLHSLIQKPEYAPLSNVMILIYVHMVTDNAEDLAVLLSNILGHKVPKNLSKQQFVKELYFSHAINQQDVAQKAANIDITKRLNATMSSYLPVHCICAMLHWRSFSKYSTSINEWIKMQMLECVTPVHPIMSHLLENFATSCIPSETYLHFNQSIDEQFFIEIFSGEIFDDSKLVIRLLSLAFLVAFSFKLDSSPNREQLGGTNKTPKAYSFSLWKLVPIRYLMIMADIRHSDFQYIKPMLQRYLMSTFSHILPEQMHFDVFKGPNSYNSSKERYNVVPFVDFSSALEDAVNGLGFFRLAKLTDLLISQPIQSQMCHFETILKAMSVSLDEERWPRALVEKLALLWERFDSVIPHRLHEDTIRLWLKSPQASHIPNLDGRDNDFLIAHAPLILFRADARVFKSPTHLKCFCRLLAFYLSASRDANYLKLTRAIAYNTKSEMTEKEELLRSYIGTQRLAVVQVFIELCDGDSINIPNLEEIRQILCTQIHQFFIADAHLPKLVHFNMYPVRLIPLIVKRVPSAHVLINSINELLTGGNLERRIFTIVLMTELLEKYKIPSAFAALTLISDLLDSLISNNVNEEFIILMYNIIPSLVRLIMLSPFHAEYFLTTIHRTRKLAKNRLSLYASYTKARTSPEQKLIELLDKAIEKLPKLPE